MSRDDPGDKGGIEIFWACRGKRDQPQLRCGCEGDTEFGGLFGDQSAVNAITRVLANELGARKIRVNAIAPGPVETEGIHELGILGSDFEKQMVAETRLGA